MKIRQSFPTQWIIAAVILLTGALLLATGHVKRQTEAKLIANYGTQAIAYCRMLAEGISLHAAHHASSIAHLAGNHGLAYLESDNIESDLAAYEEGNDPAVRGVFVLDSAGDPVYTTFPLDSSIAATVTSQMDWLKDAAHRGETTTVPIVSPDAVRLLILAPVFPAGRDRHHPSADGDFVGVVGIDLELDALIKETITVAHFPLDFCIGIVDEEGRFVFCNEKTGMYAVSRQHGHWNCQECHQNGQALTAMASGAEGVGEFTNPDREAMTIVFVSLDLEGSRWHLLVSTPTHEVLASTHALSNQYMAIFGGLVLFIILCGLILVQSVRRQSRLRALGDHLAEMTEVRQTLEDDIARRLLAEDMLRESEEKYRSMIEHAHDLIWALDRQGNFTYFNQRSEEISGYKLSEWMGRSFVPMLHPDDVPRIQDVFIKTLNGESQQFEVAVYRADGSQFILDVSSAPEYKSGEIIGVVSFGKDITERKRVEEALEKGNLKVRESERRLREAEQLAHLGNWELDLVSNSLLWSDEIYRIFDLAPQKFGATYRAFLDAIHPDDREYVNQAYLDSLARKTAYDIEHRLLMKNGRVKYVRECCQTYYDEDGKPFRSVGTVQDITDRKKAEGELRRQNDYLTALQETTLDLLAEHDLDRLLENILKRAGELVGTTTGWLDLLEPGADHLTPKIALGVLETEARRFATQKGEGLSGKVWQSGQPIAIEDYDAWPGRVRDHKRNMIRSIVAVPLLSGSEVLGVLGLAYAREVDFSFDEAAINVLSQFARMASLAIENARLFSTANRELAERMQAEEALQRTHNQLQQMMDSSPAMIYSCKASGDFDAIFISENITALLGYTPAEFLTPGFWASNIHPEDSSRVFEDLSHVFEAGRHIHEYRFRHKDGTWRLMHDELKVIRDETGHPLQMVGYWVDETESKQTEETLQENAERLRLLFDNLTIGVYRTTPEGKVLVANPALVKMLGYSSFDELEQIDLEQGGYAPSHPRSEFKRRVEREGEVLGLESAWIRTDGSVMIVRENARAVRGDDGTILYYEGTAEDVTVQRQAEEARRESEERFRQVVESADEWIWEVDTQGLYRYASPVVEKMLGYAPEELVGKMHFYDLFAPEVRDELTAGAFSAFARKESFRGFVNPGVHKDGRRVILETNGVPILDATGALLGYRGADMDITERKQAEDALRESENLLRHSQSVARMGSYKLDILAGRWTSSPGLDELLGIDAEYARTMDGWFSLIHPEWRDIVMQYFSTEILGKGKRLDKEGKIVRPSDGQERWVHALGDLSFDEHGRPIKMIGTIQDITERKQAEAAHENLEAQLRQAQKLETIGTLAGGIAHDFNNILTPIMVYTEMAARRLGEGHPQRRDLEQVIAGANRAKDLVKQILTFSRQTEHERVSIELSPIVKEALKLLQASLPSTIAIRTNIQAGCGEVLADPSQIHQVLMNLCTNAYHAMREHGGELGVNLEAVTLTEEAARAIPELSAGEYARLTVSDTGCGMDERTQERIFEPFFTTKKLGEGTGLGLSVVHGIIKSHGGAITVQSEVGKGTLFEVYLPRVRATHQTQVIEQLDVAGGHEHILVVDDETDVAEVLRDVLESSGYTVAVRTSSIEALELLRRHPNRFDLVITDQTMPHLTGDHLAREILMLRKDLPIILMTGFSQTIDEERCRQLGIAGFLLKPPLTADLLRLVRRVLDGVPA